MTDVNRRGITVRDPRRVVEHVGPRGPGGVRADVRADPARDRVDGRRDLAYHVVTPRAHARAALLGWTS